MVYNDEALEIEVTDYIFEKDPEDADISTNFVYGGGYGENAAIGFKRPFKTDGVFSTYLVDNWDYSLFLSYFVGGATSTDESLVYAETDENGLPDWKNMVIHGPSPVEVTKEEHEAMVAAEGEEGEEEGETEEELPVDEIVEEEFLI